MTTNTVKTNSKRRCLMPVINSVTVDYKDFRLMSIDINNWGTKKDDKKDQIVKLKINFIDIP